jgi:hypothetical protein
MRRGTFALTVAFALGVGGLVSAEESGNWFTRWFTRSAEKTPEKTTKSSTAKDGLPTLTPTLPNVAILQAQANWQRRQNVCLRLREIAIATNDDDLLQKSEQLDLRAYELYQAARSRSQPQEPIGSISAKDLKAADKRSKGAR